MTDVPGTVRGLVERQARARPDAVYALAADGTAPIPYAALEADCAAVAAALGARGVAPGETVATVLPNGLQALRLLLGAMHGGRVVVPVNLLAQAESMRHVLAHSDCRLVVVSPDWEARVRELLACVERPVAVAVVEPHGDRAALVAALAGPHATAAAPEGAERAPTPDAAALLMYTSGTTGLPKGVVLTHGALVANAIAIAREHALGAADRVLGVLPLYHINAFVVTMLAPLASGGSVALAPRFSAATFWEQALARGCTWINVVPTIVSYLLEAPGPPPEALRAIRFCRSASAALPAEHHRAFEARFGIGIVETMGLTETAAPSFSNPLEPARRKVGSVGRASGGEAQVVDAELVPLPDGMTGEIVIRGPHVMRGYHKDDAATRAAITPEGWLRTGDLGHRDADGFFFVTGRIKELIIKGGENIAPREIDEALLLHPAVLEAAAVGIPDRHYGQEILACVVLREGERPDPVALREFCVERLGRYKTPKEFRFLASLPRGPSGKVQRLKLLESDPTA
jgi:long-chain acyl-CoA synthetase